jgi:hypothetical protein
LSNNNDNLKKNARKFAEENLTMDNILSRFFTQLTKNVALSPTKPGLVSG